MAHMGHGGKRCDVQLRGKSKVKRDGRAPPVVPACARGPLESISSLRTETKAACVWVSRYIEFGADSNTNRTITQHGHRRTDCT